MRLLPGALGVVIAVPWIAGLLLLERGKARRDRQVAELVEGPLQRQALQRRVAAEMLIPAVLQHTGFPDHYEFRLYLLDADSGMLLPSYEPDAQASAGWRIGQGVTGKVWETGEYEAAAGEGVSDSAYGLDADQQARYAHLQVVAAMPVRSARNELIAVLTASSDVDDGVLVSPDGKERHRVLADVIARVLIDVLQLTHD
jgi:hypothetical protein